MFCPLHILLRGNSGFVISHANRSGMKYHFEIVFDIKVAVYNNKSQGSSAYGGFRPNLVLSRFLILKRPSRKKNISFSPLE
jgi:hypothetical protein